MKRNDGGVHRLYACKRYGNYEYQVIIVYSTLEDKDLEEWLKKTYRHDEWQIEFLDMDQRKDISVLQDTHCEG